MSRFAEMEMNNRVGPSDVATIQEPATLPTGSVRRVGEATVAGALVGPWESARVEKKQGKHGGEDGGGSDRGSDRGSYFGGATGCAEQQQQRRRRRQQQQQQQRQRQRQLRRQ